MTGFASETLNFRVASAGKLFTADRDLIASEVGALKPESLKRLVDAVVDLLRAGG
jgi:hypothetical protein